MNSYLTPESASRHLKSIWIVPAFVLAIGIVMIIWFAYEEHQQVLQQEYGALEAQARIADSQLSGLLRHIELILNHIATERPTLPAPALANYSATTLTRLKHDLPEIRTLAVIDASGRVEATINPSLHGFDASQRDYFTTHRDQVLEPDFHVTRPFKSSFGDYSIAFSHPIRDVDKQLLGVAIAGVNYQFFERVLKPIMSDNPDSMVAILNKEGDFLYHWPDPEKYAGANVGSSAQFQNYLHAGQPMVRSIGVARTDGVDRIYVHRAIDNSGLILAIGLPLKHVLAEWRHNVLLRIPILILATAATLFLAWMAHQRQRKVLAGKAFTEQLIETVNVMLVGLNAKGEVILFNETAALISGYRRDEVLGRRWFDRVIPPEHFEAARQMFNTAWEIGRIPQSCEYPLVTRDGRQRTIAWRNSLIFDGNAMSATIFVGVDITARAEMEKIRREAEVSRRLVQLQEEEKRRLAFVLHDRTSPNLSALEMNWKLLTDSVYAYVPDAPTDLLEDTAALIDDTIESIRAVSAEFYPPVLEYTGFWPAVEGYAQHFSRRTGIAVQASNTETELLHLPPEIETNLFRIVQEALTNCARHSHAKTVNIGQVINGDRITLDISDDGTGFNPDTPTETGLGLQTMQNRAEFIGAHFSLETKPGMGTHIAVEFMAHKRFRRQAVAQAEALAA